MHSVPSALHFGLPAFPSSLSWLRVYIEVVEGLYWHTRFNVHEFFEVSRWQGVTYKVRLSAMGVTCKQSGRGEPGKSAVELRDEGDQNIMAQSVAEWTS